MKYIDNSALTLSDVPETLRGWQEFALTFPGYKVHGGFAACAAIANKRNPVTLTEYRTCLYFEQRRWRNNDCGPFGFTPTASHKSYIRSLLAGIRKRVGAKGDNMKSRVFTKASVQCLRPILKEWVRLNDSLSREWAVVGDAPWWYNERASVSVLAGAVWKVGDYAFEEYASVKKHKKKYSAGRLDLQFTASGREFIAEAKQCWIPATRKQHHADVILDALKRAQEDVEKCEAHGMRRLAIVFGVPYITLGWQSELPDRVNSFIAQAGEVDAHAFAWVFPAVEFTPKSKGRLYPGVAVWIKEVK